MANHAVEKATALYLYGISKSSSRKSSAVAGPGIDSIHPVQSLAWGDFFCWVSAVEKDTFADEISRNMENLEWLALHGVRHQQVVGGIASMTGIIPARFGTI